jgi:hypothetical protein
MESKEKRKREMKTKPVWTPAQREPSTSHKDAAKLMTDGGHKFNIRAARCIGVYPHFTDSALMPIQRDGFWR